METSLDLKHLENAVHQALKAWHSTENQLQDSLSRESRELEQLLLEQQGFSKTLAQLLTDTTCRKIALQLKQLEYKIEEKIKRISQLKHQLRVVRSVLNRIRRKAAKLITYRSILSPRRRDEVFRKKRLTPDFFADIVHALTGVQSEFMSAGG